jgi:hypothetical protein
MKKFTHKDEQPHFQLSDDAFEQQFADCELDAELFSHEAHLRLAWIHVMKYGVETAVDNVSQQLKNYTQYLGAAEKYNKTVTVAAVRAVNHFVNKSSFNNFSDFINEFPRLKNKFKEIIGFHYGIDIFKSEQAKKEYVEPDLLSFT